MPCPCCLRAEERISPLVNWGTLEKYYPNYPDIDDLTITSHDREAWLDLRPYMEKGPHILYGETSLQRGYKIFRTLGLRHLYVVDYSNHLIGMVTRTELLPEQIARYEERSHDVYGRKRRRGVGGNNRNSPKNRRLHENGMLEMMERGGGGGYHTDDNYDTTRNPAEGFTTDPLKTRVTLDGLLLDDTCL
jgi:hypothetical protein